jgi:ankyrin repeat protein
MPHLSRTLPPIPFLSSLLQSFCLHCQFHADAAAWDEGHNIHLIERYSLLEFQRSFESFLRLRHSRAADDISGRAAAVDLCRGRNLPRIEANERDDNAEARLISLAAGGGSAEDVRLLVAAGADVAAVAEEGRSALYWACAARQGHVEVMQALARAGADCNQADSRGITPLWVASLNGHLRCVEELLQRGADVDKARTDFGMTPLYVASSYGHSNIVDVLLRAAAIVDKAKTLTGDTPLFVASQNGHSKIVELLLRAAADVNKARTNDGVTPVLIASQNGHSNVVDALLRAAADINTANT